MEKEKVMKNVWDKNVYARVIGEAYYIINKGATIRETARVFKMSKSTVHKDVTVNLKVYDLALAERVSEVLRKNKAERHIRGGNATSIKYKQIRSNNKAKEKK